MCKTPENYKYKNLKLKAHPSLFISVWWRGLAGPADGGRRRGPPGSAAGQFDRRISPSPLLAAAIPIRLNEYPAGDSVSF